MFEKRLFGNTPRNGKTIQTDRITCPSCGYPMRILADDGNGVYQCYCASCKMDKVVKVMMTKLTVKEFNRRIERGKVIGEDELVELVNHLHEENKGLIQSLKNMCYNEICEVCKYGKYERNWYGEGEFECLKKHFGNDDWKCDGLQECDDFEVRLEDLE